MGNQKSSVPNTQGRLVNDNIQYIVPIASGKGGVGKSTVTANLALALASEGYRVGILDADIYGPSQGKLLGIAENTRPTVTKVDDQPYYVPIHAHALQVMSMAFLAGKKTPVIWRGPMASGALQQMLLQTNWEQLDILLVDMPPGTGDIQLTLSQKVSLSGSIVVTTPQDIALLDARKAIEMFTKVNVPLLGIVENMAWHTCTKCGHKEAIFGKNGGQILSTEYDVPCLGSIPLALSIRTHGDEGKPCVIADPEGEHAQTYKLIARSIMHALKNDSGIPMPEIMVDE